MAFYTRFNPANIRFDYGPVKRLPGYDRSPKLPSKSMNHAMRWIYCDNESCPKYHDEIHTDLLGTRCNHCETKHVPWRKQTGSQPKLPSSRS